MNTIGSWWRAPGSGLALVGFLLITAAMVGLVAVTGVMFVEAFSIGLV